MPYRPQYEMSQHAMSNRPQYTMPYRVQYAMSYRVQYAMSYRVQYAMSYRVQYTYDVVPCVVRGRRRRQQGPGRAADPPASYCSSDWSCPPS